MSDPPGSSTPKAIGSLAKKQSDVTRQGTQKLKFVPTLPQRRKKEDVKQEPAGPSVPPSPLTERASTRSRGRGDGMGRGRGRGAPPIVEMTASGPFAMGPSMAGGSSRRTAPRSNFVPSVNPDGASTNLGGNLSQVGPPLLRKEAEGKAEKEKGVKVKVEDEEVYSDPEEGVEIVDMEHVRQMDWMAPEILRKERQNGRKKRVKKEERRDDAGEVDADPSQALDLSESEEEEEVENMMEDFGSKVESDESLTEERLYFFQFPSPFPTFVSKKSNAMDVDQAPDITEKKVTFAPDVKPEAPGPSRTPSTVPDCQEIPKKTEPVDGIIGQLEVYRSGAVKIRLANDILLDVNAATQPSFLQQAVYLDKAEKELVILGEVNKQFVVSPNVDALLSALEKEDTGIGSTNFEGEENLIKMD